jgi:hypothetical protein
VAVERATASFTAWEKPAPRLMFATAGSTRCSVIQSMASVR